MSRFFFLLALAAPLGAAAPDKPRAERDLAAVFTRIDQLHARQFNRDAREIAALDREIQTLAPEALKWGWQAVGPLSRVLEDRRRPAKIRLFALSFLGLTHDPLALEPLTRALADPAQPAALRSAAAASLPIIRVSRKAVREALCPALKEPELPEEVLAMVLLQLSRLGCEDPEPLTKRVRSLGNVPRSAKEDHARHAILALGRSHSLEAVRALIRLLIYYPTGSKQRLLVLQALGPRGEDLAPLNEQGSDVLLLALGQEKLGPNLLAAIPLTSYLETAKAAPPLLKLLEHKDPEVVAAAAEALAKLKAQSARERLAELLARAAEDPRFALKTPAPGPRLALERIIAAEKSFRD